jgi:hypothetical protein
MTREQLQQWIRRFDAIAEVDREALRREGPRSKWSIATALSLIEAAGRTFRSSPLLQDLRRQEDQAVRATWSTLRHRLSR